MGRRLSSIAAATVLLSVVIIAALAAAVILREADGQEAEELSGFPLIDCTTESYAPPPDTSRLGDLEGVDAQPVSEVPGAIDVAADPTRPLLWVALQYTGVVSIPLDEIPPEGEALDPDGLGQRLVLDLRGEVADGYEQGVLGVTVDPNGEELYVHRTATDDSTLVTAHAIVGDRPSSQGRVVLDLAQPAPSHNGGDLQFGPDGMLYLALGDGGFSPVDRPDDPSFSGNAQDLSSPFGAILRLDPAADSAENQPPELGDGVAVPGDNPFADEAGLGAAIWVTGARNPYSFSFDRDTGDLWVADVGQHCWEEINLLAADDGENAGRGENLGWPWLEGRHIYEQEPPHDDHVLPVHTYVTGDNGCAVIGGSVYRGSAIEDLQGWYVFGDNCTTDVQALRVTGDDEIELRGLGVDVERLAAISTDDAGELLVASMTDGILRLVPDDET